MDRQANWGLIALCDSNFLFKYIKMKKKKVAELIMINTIYECLMLVKPFKNS